VVAPAAWLTSGPAAALRKSILEHGGPAVVAPLGQRVFDTAPLLFASLAVIERSGGAGSGRARLFACRDGSAESLRAAAREGGTVIQHEAMRASRDSRFAGVPLPASGPGTRWTTMGELFEFFDGVWSGDNARDVREASEVDADDPEWVPASGGQGYRRWYAPIRRRIRASFVHDWPVLDLRDGAVEYARVAGGKLAARLVRGRSAAIAGVVTCVPREAGRVLDVLAIFNTRVGTLWLRSLTSGLNFNPGYAAQVPVPREALPPEIERQVRSAIGIKQQLATAEAGDDFKAPPDDIRAEVDRRIRLMFELIACEAKIEAGVAEWVGAQEEQLRSVRLPAESLLEQWARAQPDDLGEKVAAVIRRERGERNRRR
jgi:hypothetical protein